MRCKIVEILQAEAVVFFFLSSLSSSFLSSCFLLSFAVVMLTIEAARASSLSNLHG